MYSVGGNSAGQPTSPAFLIYQLTDRLLVVCSSARFDRQNVSRNMTIPSKWINVYSQLTPSISFCSVFDERLNNFCRCIAFACLCLPKHSCWEGTKILFQPAAQMFSFIFLQLRFCINRLHFAYTVGNKSKMFFHFLKRLKINNKTLTATLSIRTRTWRI